VMRDYLQLDWFRLFAKNPPADRQALTCLFQLATNNFASVNRLSNRVRPFYCRQQQWNNYLFLTAHVSLQYPQAA
jgi:hypothetical protein